ncbi:hypothetical protein [Actinocrispum wychmicini]|nr:hypothetical protein [Actinocrispum wychmicini]
MVTAALRAVRDEAEAARAQAAGSATRYPIGSIDFTRDDWIEHYGDLQ